MTVTYNLTQADNRHFLLWRKLYSHAAQKRSRSILRMTTLISLGCMLILFVVTRQKVYLGVFVGVILNEFVVLPKYFETVNRRYLDETLQEEKYTAISTQLTLTAEPEGLYYRSSDKRGLIMWSRIIKIDSSHSHLFLYTRENDALVVPFAEFENTAEREKFVETIEKYRKSDVAMSAMLA